MGNSMKKTEHKEAGQALVEFALTIPVFIAIALFIIDFGWVSYQRIAFEHGYMRASWSLTASDIGDADPLEEVPSTDVYTGSNITDKLREYIETGTWGCVAGNLSVSGVKATVYNTEEYFNVPGRMSEAVAATNLSRHMELEAEIRYVIYPITFFGKMVFGDYIELEKELDYSRIIATSQRSG